MTLPDNNLEQWKPVADPKYADLYAVSSWGRVRSLRFGRLLTPIRGKVKLCVDRVGKQLSIRKLVLAAFGHQPLLRHSRGNKKRTTHDHDALFEDFNEPRPGYGSFSISC